MDAVESLRQGRTILDQVLEPLGFRFVEGPSHKGHGKDSASGEYIKGDRRLEVHFRYSLGLVTYHIGGLSLSHEAYMRHTLGPGGGNRYPGFSDDPLDAFQNLRFDLENYCSDFLSGTGEAFRHCVDAEREYEKLAPLEKLTRRQTKT